MAIVPFSNVEVPDVWSLLPHIGVALERPTRPQDEWLLCHPTTGEKATLPKPTVEWQLVWDDGFAAVHDMAGNTILAEQVFRRPMHARANGTVAASYKTKKGTWITKDLAELKSDLRFATLTINVGSCNLEMVLEVAFLRMGRFADSKMYWNLKSLYQGMGMTSFKGWASKWVWASRSAWTRSFEEVGAFEQMLNSTRCDLKIPGRTVTQEAFLPYIAAGTLGLLVLLARWVRLSPQVGGLQTKNKAAVRDVADGFVRSGLGSRTKHTLRLELGSAEWVNPWPAQIRQHDVSLPVIGSNVDLRPWEAFTARGDCPPDVQRAWTNLQLPSSCVSYPLALLLQACYAVPKAVPTHLVHQIASQMAGWIEGNIWKVLDEKAPDDWDGISGEYTTVLSALHDMDLVNGFLFRHTLSAIRMSETYHTVTLPSDKGHCGMMLDCGYLAWPNNRTAIAVPQVGSGGTPLEGTEVRGELLWGCGRYGICGVYAPFFFCGIYVLFS